ncbi:hypothetical protein JCM11641_000820 [Rhodosporidiobolus odoratus]
MLRTPAYGSCLARQGFLSPTSSLRLPCSHALRTLTTASRIRSVHTGNTARSANSSTTTAHSTVAKEDAEALEPSDGSVEPTRSFQPHFQDLSRSPKSELGWQSSRPHEAWVMSHPVYSKEELAVDIVHHKPTNVGDKLAYWMVKAARKGFDVVSGYKHASPEAAREAAARDGKGNLSSQELVKEGYLMNERQWMARILFLESIAGVPGFTAGILRHLRSLRLMRRDGGWINSLLQEAENERMHLLTFMKIRDPSAFFRLLVLGAQGVFFNMFFISYILSPKSCHRFVGYLEEEACITYTHLLGAIERGEVPEWDSNNPKAKKVPQVAKDYWRLGDEATMYDLVAAVRADEAGHRFVNHSFANLKKDDFNPVGLIHAPPVTQGSKAGFTREESLAWAKKVQEELTCKRVEGGEKKEL